MPENRELPPAVAKVMAALAWLATAAVAIVPLAVLPDFMDRFRAVKESLTRAEGILGLFLLIVAVAFGGSVRFRDMLRERAVAALVIAGVAWTLLTTALSTHRAHSVESLIAFLTSVLVFITVWYAAPRISLVMLDVLVAITLVNTALVLVQELSIYQPFTIDPLAFRHHTATGLIGNPNLVGTYMTLMAILFAAAAHRIPGLRRWWYAFGMCCGILGVFVSRARTAFIALVVGFALIAIAISMRRAMLFAGAVVVVLVGGYFLNIRVIQRVIAVPQRIAWGGLEIATSGRLTPAMAAMAMARDHPVTGVGPGAFKYQYFPYQIEARRAHGQRLRGVGSTNFGEAHNDHLQMLAESGFPGYLLFLAMVVALVRAARRAPPDAEADDARAAFVRALAIPLAGTFLVLCLAQFPLHVAITRQLLMTVAGLVVGWSRR
jgi:O-antigen ligase